MPPAVAPIIAGAAATAAAGAALAGALTGITLTIAATVIGGLVSVVVAKAFADDPEIPSYQGFEQSMRDRVVTVKQPIVPWQVIYGRCRVGGALTFAHTTGTDNEYLHMVITLACHEVHTIDEIWFNEEKLQINKNGMVVDSRYTYDVQQSGSKVISDFIETTVPTSPPYSIDLPAGWYTESLEVHIWSDSWLLPFYFILSEVRSEEVSWEWWSTTVYNYQCPYYALGETALNPGWPFHQEGPVVGSPTPYRTISFNSDLAGRKIRIIGAHREAYPVYTYSHAYVYTSLGDEAAGGQPFPPLNDATGGLWSNSDNQTGRAKIYVKLKWNADLFPNGIPNVTAVVQGKKVYDPRDSPATTHWTSNPVLCIVDYLCSSDYGLGLDYATEIDEAQVIAAANVCEELVENKLTDGTLSPSGNNLIWRYMMDGAFDVSDTPQRIIERMLTSIAGKVTFIGGVWRVIPAAYETPTVTLTEDDLRGPIRVQPRLSRHDLANGIKGVYVNPFAFWQPVDYPPVTNATYLSEDNDERIWREIDLPYTTNSATAQRIAKIELERTRQQIQVDLKCKLTAYELQPGDTVMLTIDRYGWSSKVFEVLTVALVSEETGDDGVALGVDLQLRETASGVYDWSITEETAVDIAPDSLLPNPFSISTPSGLTLASGEDHLLLQTDGTIISRIYAYGWTVSEFVSSGGQIEVQWIQDDDASPSIDENDWSASGQRVFIPGISSHTYITPVEDGVAYSVRIRGISNLGVRSGWNTVSAHTVIGKTSPPDDVANFAYTHKLAATLLTWDEVANVDRDTYEVRVGGSWAASQSVGIVRGSSLLLEPLAEGTHTYWIKAYDTTGNESDTEAQLDVTVTAPGTPSPSQEIVQLKVQLAWAKPALGSYDIAGYEIRYGASFAAGTSLGTTDGTSYRAPVDFTSTRTYWIAAFDVAGNYGTAGSVVATVAAPSAPLLTVAFNLSHAELSWTTPASTLPLDLYEVRYGADSDNWASATTYTKTKSTFLAVEVDWSGARRWFVAAIDIGGNEGADDSSTLTVTPPAAVLITAQVLDNNVLLYWSAALATLPVTTYKIKRGATYATATTIGNKDGLFTNLFETTAGTFTYWVAGIDSAGNEGTPGSATIVVSQPPDFIFLQDWDSTFPGTLSNAKLDTGTGYITMPINTTETWEEHFQNNPGGSPNWGTPQDQVDAGYPIYIQPTVETGYYEEIFDYEATVASTKVTVSYTGLTKAGSPSVAVTISTAPDESPTEWTDFENTSQIYATNFRYVKVRITVTASSPTGTDVYELQLLNVRLDVKLLSDAGTVTCSAGDAGGTPVTFAQTFIDVTSITVTPRHTGSPEQPVTAIYDFLDEPNPTGFTIYLFDTNTGVRLSGDASWAARGF